MACCSRNTSSCSSSASETLLNDTFCGAGAGALPAPSAPDLPPPLVPLPLFIPLKPLSPNNLVARPSTSDAKTLIKASSIAAAFCAGPVRSTPPTPRKPPVFALMNAAVCMIAVCKLRRKFIGAVRTNAKLGFCPPLATSDAWEMKASKSSSELSDMKTPPSMFLFWRKSLNWCRKKPNRTSDLVMAVKRDCKKRGKLSFSTVNGSPASGILMFMTVRTGVAPSSPPLAENLGDASKPRAVPVVVPVM